MTDRNSDTLTLIRPEALQNELSIGHDTYYCDLRHLGIKADKDDDGKVYLTNEQAEQVRQLRSYVSKYGTRKGFVYEKVDDTSNIGSSLVTTTNNNIETTENKVEAEIATATEEDIYISETSPTDDINLDNLIRTAQELAARNIAIPSLIATELASNMEFDDLPTDLQEKVRIAQDAANPKKHQPKLIAQTLLKQWRSQRAS